MVEHVSRDDDRLPVDVHQGDAEEQRLADLQVDGIRRRRGERAGEPQAQAMGRGLVQRLSCARGLEPVRVGAERVAARDHVTTESMPQEATLVHVEVPVESFLVLLRPTAPSVAVRVVHERQGAPEAGREPMGQVQHVAQLVDRGLQDAPVLLCRVPDPVADLVDEDSSPLSRQQALDVEHETA